MEHVGKLYSHSILSLSEFYLCQRTLCIVVVDVNSCPMNQSVTYSRVLSTPKVCDIFDWWSAVLFSKTILSSNFGPRVCWIFSFRPPTEASYYCKQRSRHFRANWIFHHLSGSASSVDINDVENTHLIRSYIFSEIFLIPNITYIWGSNVFYLSSLLYVKSAASSWQTRYTFFSMQIRVNLGMFRSMQCLYR